MDMGEEYRIKDMLENERPRERLAQVGPQALSNAELLAILLRVGIRGVNAVQLGNQLLKRFDGLNGLHKASFLEVCQVTGVGEAKAAQIKAAIELGFRLSLERQGEKPEIRNPQDAAALVQHSMAALPQEHLWVMNLDTRNRVIHIDRLYKGSLNSSTVRVGELFRSAIQNNAASIIMVHNHPSGDPTPSPDDIHITRAVEKAGQLLDIELLDHLVIGSQGFVSMKEKSLGFG